MQVDYPIGHRQRRAEGMPVLVKKFEDSVAAHFSPRQTESIKAMFADSGVLAAMPVSEFVARLVTAVVEINLSAAALHYDASGLPNGRAV